MEITWQVVNLERNAEDHFVVTVHYRVKAVDGDYTASRIGAVNYTQSEESFIPYADLTKETVIGWVKNSLDVVVEVEADLTADIEAQKAPALLSGMPWVTEEVA